MNKEKISDFTLRITQSNRSQLVVVIYDMTIEYLDDAIEYFKSDKVEEFLEASKKARACIYELMSSLDTKYPISADLMQLYLYMSKLIIKSIAKKNPQDFEAMKRMIKNLSEAFSQIAKQDMSEPLMKNTQQVYAGLTYGKGTLEEGFSNQNFNRGFQA